MIRLLPLFAGIAPVAGVSIAYWLNVDAGLLPSCMPLLEGCTSISSTGRMLPGGMIFRAILLPQATLLIALWWISAAWLARVAPEARSGKAIVTSGVIGAAALVLYVTFLGTKEPFYEFMRHFGIYFYFLGTAVSQILLTLAMPRSSLRTAMLWVIATPFALGVINLVQKSLLSNPDYMENRIEWTAALLMQVWFVQLYVAWRRTGLTLKVDVDSTSAR